MSHAKTQVGFVCVHLEDLLYLVLGLLRSVLFKNAFGSLTLLKTLGAMLAVF